MSSAVYVFLGCVAILGGVAALFDLGGISSSTASMWTRATAINPPERRTRFGRWLADPPFRSYPGWIAFLPG